MFLRRRADPPSLGSDPYMFDPFVMRVPIALDKSLLCRSLHNANHCGLGDTQPSFQLLQAVATVRTLLQQKEQVDLRHCQIVGTQQVIRVFFQRVMDLLKNRAEAVHFQHRNPLLWQLLFYYKKQAMSIASDCFSRNLMGYRPHRPRDPGLPKAGSAGLAKACFRAAA